MNIFQSRKSIMKIRDYEFNQEYKKYNSVMKSEQNIYGVNDKYISMSFQDKIPDRIIRDLLTQEEITQLQRLKDQGNYPLVAVCKKDDEESFCGFYPLNAGIDQDKIPHRIDGELDTLKNFCSGG